MSEYLYTLINNEAILIYVRFVRDNQFVEKMFFIRKLITDTNQFLEAVVVNDVSIETM